MSRFHADVTTEWEPAHSAGYIIKEEGISICMSSKHLQTRRLLSTLQAYLFEVRGMLVQLWREANEREEETFMDHAGVLRNARTGEPVSSGEDEGEDALRKLHCCPSVVTDVQSADSGSSTSARRRSLPRRRGEDRRSARCCLSQSIEAVMQSSAERAICTVRQERTASDMHCTIRLTMTL